MICRPRLENGTTPSQDGTPDSRVSVGSLRIERVFEDRGFVHLNVRTNFSLKDGAFFPEELALRAAELGMPAVALAGRHDAAVAAARPFREAFGGDLLVEVRHRLERDSVEQIRRLLRVADDLGVDAVATNAVRYLVPEDAFLADALEC